jgi:hypothetical protein
MDSTYAFTKGNTYEPGGKGKNGWKLYDPVGEFGRQGSLDNPKWRLYLNGFSTISTYPHTLLVPTFISDDQIAEVVAFRSKGRIPAVTWYNKKNGCVMARASQPLVGITAKRCVEYLKSISRQVLCS